MTPDPPSRLKKKGTTKNQNVKQRSKSVKIDITLREEILREENFANFSNFGQIRENKFLFWPSKMSIHEEKFLQNFSELVIREN